MLDFTSSLYLGFTHPSEALAQWRRLTDGVPMALRVSPSQQGVECELARLLGAERAMLAPSSLHLFWDLFGQPLSHYTKVIFDEGAYAISRGSAQRASNRGAEIARFTHHSPEALDRRLRAMGPGTRPVVLADGFCVSCGKAAPLADYLSLVSARRGLLLVDDTQALGMFGAPAPGRPGGGGCLAGFGTHRPHLLVVASLAKAFGVPAAVLAGDAAWLRHVVRHSETAVHCSPPSACDISATHSALALNECCGDRLRLQLRGLVTAFRRALAGLDLVPSGGSFPVQTLAYHDVEWARALHRGLLRAGVRTVLRRVTCMSSVGVSFILTVRHSRADIWRAVRALANALQHLRQQNQERLDDRFNRYVPA